MRLYWTSSLLLGLVILHVVPALAAPGAKGANSKPNPETKPSPLTQVSANKQSINQNNKHVSVQDKSEYNVPSSKLDQGQHLKATSITRAGKNTKDFLATETSKLGSKSDKATEKKLMKMLFDKKDSTLISPRSDAKQHFTNQHEEYKSNSEHMLHDMRPDKHQKKQKQHFANQHQEYKSNSEHMLHDMRPDKHQKKQPQQQPQQQQHALQSAKDMHRKDTPGPKLGHFNVFKVHEPSNRPEKHNKPGHANRMPRHHRRGMYEDKGSAHPAPWNQWKQSKQPIDGHSVEVERFRRPSLKQMDDKRARYEVGHRYGPVEEEREHYPGRKWHRLPRHVDMDKDEEMREFPNKSVRSFKESYSPREFGFDSVFAPAYQPGGFGEESFGHIDHSRRMFSGGFSQGY